MKIGLDLRFYRSGTGGVGRYSRNLLAELLKIDQQNEYTAIITPADQPEFTLTAPNLRTLVVDIVHYSSAEQIKLLQILNQEKFDLVHFAMFNHPLLYRRPFVVTVHDLIMQIFPTGSQKTSLIKRLGYRLVMNDCKRANKIIVPSEATKNDLVDMLNFPSQKIVITPEGSEAAFHQASKAAQQAVAQKFGLPEHYLLFVSRWEEYKGIYALIEAHKQISQRFPDVALVICGRPDKQNPKVAEAVKVAQANGQKIITPGFVNDEDLVPLYSGATAYIHPSWYEGFGIMILEAFAAGAPVVTSNTSSLPEVVGGAGMLINPKKPEEIVTAVEKLLGDEALRQDYIAKGLERVKQFSWATMARQTLAVYNEVIHEQR